jgi:hypothetical protein
MVQPYASSGLVVSLSRARAVPAAAAPPSIWSSPQSSGERRKKTWCRWEGCQNDVMEIDYEAAVRSLDAASPFNFVLRCGRSRREWYVIDQEGEGRKLVRICFFSRTFQMP